jgi:hypothetical protein
VGIGLNIEAVGLKPSLISWFILSRLKRQILIAFMIDRSPPRFRILRDKTALRRVSLSFNLISIIQPDLVL